MIKKAFSGHGYVSNRGGRTRTGLTAATGKSALALAKASGRPYYLNPEITLQPAVNFEVILRYPAAVPTPTGFNGRVGVILDGYFQRASQ